MTQSIERDLVANTQEPLADTTITRELEVETEVSQGKEGKSNIHEPMVDTVVTQ